MRALRAALVQMTVQEKTEDSLARAEGFLRRSMFDSRNSIYY